MGGNAETAKFKLTDIEAYEHEDGILPTSINPPQEFNLQDIPDKLTITKTDYSIDYSKKSKREQAQLAATWKKEGLTRREIAMRLYSNDLERFEMDTLMKRVDRLTAK